MARLGTLVIAGLTYQITRLELKDGALVITATRSGEAPAAVNEVITIFDQDGQGFGQGGHVSIARTKRWQTAKVEVKVRLETLY